MTELPFPATRAHALDQLDRFIARTPDDLRGSSGLGAYLRCRLISEQEAAQKSVSRLSGGVTEPTHFLEQLLWGAYWRGWLEGRPQVYAGYRRQLSQDRRRWTSLDGYRSAVEGRTGLSAFDSWNRKLLETGFLPHQERVWYASIWIFTLRLPWTLGADHFFRHLLDGDIAANTLSWRWVAGLHPPGKPVLARADDIEKAGGETFSLKGRLQETASGLKGPPIAAARPLLKLPPVPSALLGERYGLFVTPKDLSTEMSGLSALRPRIIVLAGLGALDDQEMFAPRVSAFLQEALLDAKDRLTSHFQCPVSELRTEGDVGTALSDLLGAEDVPHLCYQQPTMGPWLELVNRLTSRDVGLKYFPVRRQWDAELFPHATKGYLQFKSSAMPVLRKLVVGS